MEYTKPQVIAQNKAQGSYAAGCPADQDGMGSLEWQCRKCDRTK